MNKRTKEDRWASIGKTAAGSGILGGLATLALAGAMLGGLWKGGTEVGGALDDDDYTGRIIGGIVGGGPIGRRLECFRYLFIKT